MLTIQHMDVAIESEEGLGLEPGAFRAYYDEALPRIYGYLLHRVGGSVSVAEDLTQETFFAVVAELKKGRRVEQPLPWTFGIARHILIHHYRRQERLERPLVDEQIVPDATSIPDGGTREQAAAALSVLPASQRVALVLRHLDGFSVPEIAAMLDKSVEAVESLLARGRVTFKRAYLEASA